MPSLLLFNPENDLALASGTPRYTPPIAAWHLHLAGEMLPLWYANPGDRILCQGVNDKWFTDICNSFDIKNIDVYDDSQASSLQPKPWGWSPASRTTFRDQGIPEDVLPSDEAIECMRQLSHRRTAAVLAEALHSDSTLCNVLTRNRLAPPATLISDINALNDILKSNKGIIIKAPWSSSGRGVFDSTKLPPQKFTTVAADFIRRYGSVMAEEKYRDITDFALLFRCEDGICRLWGYSSFLTSSDGRYIANRLMSDDSHRTILSNLVGFDIDILGNSVAKALTQIIGESYSGYLGVDMLVGKDACDNPVLDAAVEINLRYTMGIVAAYISRRYIAPEALASGIATFSVKPTSKQAKNQPTITNGKLKQGTLSLTPDNPWFDFTVNIP